MTRFHALARRITDAAGHPVAFGLACAVVVAWALSGPFFGFSETWQLVINTGTTICTFLMVFLLQCSQNADTRALHLKIDELITATEGASNQLVGIERGDSC